MKKNELFATFGGEFSKSRIVPTGGEPGTYKLVGKYTEVEPMDDGKFDVWVTDTRSPDTTLGTGKRNNIVATLKEQLGDIKIHLSDGEAWFQVDDPMVLVPLAKVLGIRRTRKLSEEQHQALKCRMARVRRAA